MLFIVGLILGIAGVAALVMGTFPLPGGKRASRQATRLAGICWIAFLPLALALRYLLSFVVLPENLPMVVVHGIVAGGCFFAGVFFLMRDRAK